jgi:hypothetical protein
MNLSTGVSRTLSRIRFYPREIGALFIHPRVVESQETFKFICGFNQALVLITKKGETSEVQHPTMVTPSYKEGWTAANALWIALSSAKTPTTPDASRGAILEMLERRAATAALEVAQ